MSRVAQHDSDCSLEPNPMFAFRTKECDSLRPQRHRRTGFIRQKGRFGIKHIPNFEAVHVAVSCVQLNQRARASTGVDDIGNVPADQPVRKGTGRLRRRRFCENGVCNEAHGQ